jgi:DNA helicase IV
MVAVEGRQSPNLVYTATRLSSLIRLRKRPFVGFMSDPLSVSAREMELDGDHIRIMRRGQVSAMSVRTLESAPSLRKGMLGTALTIRAGKNDTITLKGAGHHAATEFAEGVSQAWIRFNLAALEKEAERLDRILDALQTLSAPCRDQPLRQPVPPHSCR